MKKQLSVIYSGRVQGVGFRYYVLGVAEKLGVTGWVRNTADLEVEITAEAEEGVLIEFLTKIEQEFKAHIKNRQVEWSLAGNIYSKFEIRF